MSLKYYFFYNSTKLMLGLGYLMGWLSILRIQWRGEGGGGMYSSVLNWGTLKFAGYCGT